MGLIHKIRCSVENYLRSYNQSWLDFIEEFIIFRNIFIDPGTLKQEEIPKKFSKSNYTQEAERRLEAFRAKSKERDEDVLACYYLLSCIGLLGDSGNYYRSELGAIINNLNDLINKGAPEFIKNTSIWQRIKGSDRISKEVSEGFLNQLVLVRELDRHLVNYKQKQQIFGYLANAKKEDKLLTFKRKQLYTRSDAVDEYKYFKVYKYRKESKQLARRLATIFLTFYSTGLGWLICHLLNTSVFSEYALIRLAILSAVSYTACNIVNPKFPMSIYEQVFAGSEYNLERNNIYTFDCARSESYADLLISTKDDETIDKHLNKYIEALHKFITDPNYRSDKFPVIEREEDRRLVRHYIRKTCEAAAKMVAYDYKRRKAGHMPPNENSAERFSAGVFYGIRNNRLDEGEYDINRTVKYTIRNNSKREEELLKEIGENDRASLTYPEDEVAAQPYSPSGRLLLAEASSYEGPDRSFSNKEESRRNPGNAMCVIV